ncbi:MAG: FAD-dependent oxidoreductase [Desulfobaccales bacterium]
MGAVLVVGGGIAGLQAALDLADSGFFVYLADKEPALGGVMSQLDKTFPTNDCSTCILSPKLAEAGRHLNIEIIAPARVVEIAGQAGNFAVRLVEPARGVSLEKCIACGICAEKCPKRVPDPFNEGLGHRKAAYLRYPQAVPLKYCIDKDHCLYFLRGVCRACERFCPTKAIDLTEPDRERRLQVGAIILAPGFRPVDARLKPELGWGRYPNVLTALQFERLLSATGPTAGELRRPSDGRHPRRVAWLHCVGSRDETIGRGFCSAACCMFAVKQAIIAKEHDRELQPTLFYIDLRAQGKGFDNYCAWAEQVGVRFVRSHISRITEEPRTHDLEITFLDESGELKEEVFDLAVLATGFDIPAEVRQLAETAGIAVNRWGFCPGEGLEAVVTNRPGIFVCGVFQGPKDIPETVSQASAAAAQAAMLLAPARGTLTRQPQYPTERQVVGEPPRIGVFVCHCGINIAGVVDVARVAEYARSLPGVVYAEDSLFMCSNETLSHIQEVIRQENLNRVVVAACSPRTHEPLFQEALRGAGLNKYLFYLANIRNQDSWVHFREPEAATEKAMALVRMAVARVARQAPLTETPAAVTREALVVGGGLAGLTAALTLAEAGLPVTLVEQEERLGGLIPRLRTTLEGCDLVGHVKDLAQKVHKHPRIRVLLPARLARLAGQAGNFTAQIETPASLEEVRFGAAVIATGGAPYEPTEYLHGRHPRVVTQLRLGEMLAEQPEALGEAPTVVMIQCVGSREPAHPYCSRICCSEAVKNALALRKLRPRARVIILYRDMRTFGFRELYYRQAREAGVRFVRFVPEKPPQVSPAGEGLAVAVWDAQLRDTLTLPADWLVLSAALRPHPGTREVAQLCKLPYDADGFLLEAHQKLRPLEFATAGYFLCGLAHGPKFAEEIITQARGAASRALTLLAQECRWVGGPVAQVITARCAECLTCVRVCPFQVPVIDPHSHKAYIDPARCQGCGICPAECPYKAITFHHAADDQLLAEIAAAMD